MKITNKTKNTILADDVIIADTPSRRMRGLLGKKDFDKGRAMIIRPCQSIHTFFMRFSIDVLFIDKNNKVIKVIPDLRPFRLTPVYLDSAFIIEMPVGVIQLSLTSKGDTLIFE
ncbi:MAG: DUF192 domain-containing protein [Candidatus Omnitrophota bacterium]|nr:DUF192 domain-containing protein [Candidatus Omnitrophota bacterium]MBU1929573.1 DUF192 domain-containing protein [Candidatus Omnitrophota bacterium]MBU2034160.1 DUF192 domain-containing protein [Candidatus Omnitrophota bacterium]MBU2221192.1 DUF192 domain-containing protein [Candidatus Omnitrophota bacterium]MBU2258800.1 DUF192 domain-containing protein [Candidatus Omnitrophota bacterium]